MSYLILQKSCVRPTQLSAADPIIPDFHPGEKVEWCSIDGRCLLTAASETPFSTSRNTAILAKRANLRKLRTKPLDGNSAGHAHFSTGRAHD